MFTQALPKEQSIAAFVGIVHHRHMDDIKTAASYHSDIFYQGLSSSNTDDRKRTAPIICVTPQEIEKQVRITETWLPDPNHYICFNGLRGKKDSKHIYSLNGYFVDLDFHDMPASKQPKAIDGALKKLRRLVARKTVLRPTCVTFTGRGLGIFYILDNPIAAGSEGTGALKEWYSRLYKEILEVFAEHFGKAVDTSVKNFDRLCRLPGTINSNNGKFSFLYADEPVFYSLSDLNACFSKKKEQKVAAKLPVLQKSKIVEFTEASKKGFLVHRSKALDLMRDDRLMRGDKEGWRELYLCWKYNTIAQLMDRAAAKDVIEEINRDYFEDGVTAGQLANIFKAVDGVENQFGDTGYYPIKDEKLAELFKLSSEERQRYGFCCLSKLKARQEAVERTRRLKKSRNEVVERVIGENPAVTRKDLLILVNEALESETLKRIGRDTLFDIIRKIEKTKRMKSTTAHMQRRKPKEISVSEISKKVDEKPVATREIFDGRKVVGFFATEYSFLSPCFSLDWFYYSYGGYTPDVSTSWLNSLETKLSGSPLEYAPSELAHNFEVFRSFISFEESPLDRKCYKPDLVPTLLKAVLYLASFCEGYAEEPALSPEETYLALAMLMNNAAKYGDIRLYINGEKVPVRMIQKGLMWRPTEKTPEEPKAEVIIPTTKEDEALLRSYYFKDEVAKAGIGSLCEYGNWRSDNHAYDLTDADWKAVYGFMASLEKAHPQTRKHIIKQLATVCDQANNDGYLIDMSVLESVPMKKYGEGISYRFKEPVRTDKQIKASKRYVGFWQPLRALIEDDEIAVKRLFFDLRKDCAAGGTSVSLVPELSCSALLDELNYEIECADISAAVKEGIVDKQSLAVFLHDRLTLKNSIKVVS